MYCDFYRYPEPSHKRYVYISVCEGPGLHINYTICLPFTMIMPAPPPNPSPTFFVNEKFPLFRLFFKAFFNPF